jgi:hypothetical protein
MIPELWTGKALQIRVQIASGPQKKFRLGILPDPAPAKSCDENA